MRILVTGGAGYIGSHTIRVLVERGHEVVALDDLSRGHAASIACPLLQINLRDREAVFAALSGQHFDGVIHFAAFAAAGESVEHPGVYFDNNVSGTTNLLNAMNAAGVRTLVLSSSSSVYGQPKTLPVRESDPKNPESPYGESKYLVERMLPWYDQANGLKFVALRYFNAAGCSVDGSIGDDSRPATRLIPRAMKSALGKLPGFTIFGSDYPTPDGTCIRDYIHVLDLAEAHALALDYLSAGGSSEFLNVGIGRGYSNLEVIAAIKRVSKVDFPVSFGPRRPGDPAQVFADNTRIRQVLGWEPRYADLESIVSTDWLWHSQHPDGYVA